MKNRLNSIGIVCLLVTTGFIGFIHFGSENAQGTPVSGPIITDTTWNLAGNPYIVVGDVTVANGATLTIEPSVQIKFDGSYYLIIDGNLTAIGTETMRIIITSNKASPAPADWRSIRVTSTGHVEIKYCDVSYSMSGIYLYPSSNNIIINNTLSNNRVGIIIRSSSNNIIINNTLSNNGVGIKLSLSSNNTITNNHFTNEGISIRGDQLPHFNSHTIPDNNIVNGKPLYYYKDRSGINIDGIPVGQLILANCTDVDVKNIQINDTDLGIVAAYSTYITIVNNYVFSNDMDFYLYESSNNTITNNDVLNSPAFSICLELSSNNIITNNNVSLCDSGIILDLSSNNNLVTNNRVLSIEVWGILVDTTSNNNIIANNFVSNTYLGISITESSSNNTLTGNNVLNGKYGIYVGDSSYNVIMGNNISNNDIYGIYLRDSFSPDYPLNNLIYHNNIINNAVQAADDRNENSWDNGYPSGGNYWSDFDEPGEGAYDDYEGSNQDVLGSDRIVDNGSGAGGGKNPYVIDSDSQDNYPLIEPKENFMFLYEGWNLISLPLIQSDPNVGVALSSISGSYKTIQWYDSLDPDDPWKHNSTTKPQHLNDFDGIDHLIGFWIYITEPGGVLFEYFGAQPGAPENIPFHTGWNMVGFPSLSNKNMTVGLNNLDFGTEVDAIWTFDGATQTWEELEPGDDFELGRGYWIHATQECVWDVPL